MASGRGLPVRAFLFPGQGTQAVAMGQPIAQGFPGAVAPIQRLLAEMVPDLPGLMRRGPASELSRTDNAQSAVTAVNLMALAVLDECAVAADAVAGHSVGLLSALVAARALAPEGAIELAAARGRLMNRLPTGTGMLSISGLEPDAAARLAASATATAGETVVVGLVNGPTTVVLSGADRALAVAAELAEIEGYRTIRLQVSHAFHSPFMRPALADWSQVVAAQPIAAPLLPVLADTDGRRLTTADEVRTALIEQFTTAVRWDLVTTRLIDLGVDECVEVGDSKTLRSFARSYPVIGVHSLGITRSLSALKKHRALPPLVGADAGADADTHIEARRPSQAHR